VYLKGNPFPYYRKLVCIAECDFIIKEMMVVISLFRQPQPFGIKGIARCGKITKHLLSKLNPGEIAVINHVNLDRVAASGLIEKRVKQLLMALLPLQVSLPPMGLNNYWMQGFLCLIIQVQKT
jgi:hypothetical protein